jgi:hypothetical protein
MHKQETMVNGFKTVIEGLIILNYAVDCPENGCQNCSAHMSKPIWINGEITHCILRLPSLLKMEIDNCME